MEKKIGNSHIFCGDAMNFYASWKTPTVIMCDGPYGINGYKGDLLSTDGLAEWYEPHVLAWNKKATPQTTLWFWNTEQGWASVHSMFVRNGWEFKACHVWNKGMSHAAGNTNTKTISHLPVVTEVCVQYVKKPFFEVGDQKLTMKDWLRYEWGRCGLPFSKTNEACGVVDAATRKYFTKCHLWYMPPAEAFEKIANYANKYGNPEGKPYFAVNGKVLDKVDWEKQKAKFYCPIGVTNVWDSPQLRNHERLKDGTKAVHMNQKPLHLIKRIIEMSSDKKDVVWDPFAGLCTTAVACGQLERECFCSEVSESVYKVALQRVLEGLI